MHVHLSQHGPQQAPQQILPPCQAPAIKHPSTSGSSRSFSGGGFTVMHTPQACTRRPPGDTARRRRERARTVTLSSTPSLRNSSPGARPEVLAVRESARRCAVAEVSGSVGAALVVASSASNGGSSRTVASAGSPPG